MGTRLKNEAQVRRYLLPKLRNVVDYVMHQIKELNAQLIIDIVYRPMGPHSYDGSPVYQRTYQFAEAWTVEKTKPPHGMHVEGKFKYFPDVMEYNPDATIPQHGSNDPNWGSAVDYMADLIYNGRSGLKYGKGYWTEKRDAWSALYEELGSEKLEKFFKEGLEREGLNARFHW